MTKTLTKKPNIYNMNSDYSTELEAYRQATEAIAGKDRHRWAHSVRTRRYQWYMQAMKDGKLRRGAP